MYKKSNKLNHRFDPIRRKILTLEIKTNGDDKKKKGIKGLKFGYNCYGICMHIYIYI